MRMIHAIIPACGPETKTWKMAFYIAWWEEYRQKFDFSKIPVENSIVKICYCLNVGYIIFVEIHTYSFLESQIYDFNLKQFIIQFKNVYHPCLF